jgi:site-specific DNA-methyltransferase (adenine-specific)
VIAGAARIICGDARDVLPELASASFDACIADPPYGETNCAWDRRVPGWPALVRRLLKPHGSLWVFGSLRSHLETREDFIGWRLAQDVIWEKHNGSGFDTDRFRRVHEQIAHYYPADVPWAQVYKDPQKEAGEARPRATIKRRRRAAIPHKGKIEGDSTYEYRNERFTKSVLFARSMHGRAVHETHKPPELIEPILRYSCPSGGTVLDLFAGSGSTSAAALRNGRSAVAVELREECAKIARRYVVDDSPLFNTSPPGSAR